MQHRPTSLLTNNVKRLVKRRNKQITNANDSLSDIYTNMRHVTGKFLVSCKFLFQKRVYNTKQITKKS